MDEKYGVIRHFFKIMLPGFHDKLVLPPAFCRKLKEEKPKHAILRSPRGTMKVNICKNDKGLIYFKKGWKDFADLNDLCIGDAIVFEHTGGLNFNAIVFDPSACEKQFPEKVNLDEHPEDVERKVDMDSGTSYNFLNPHFTITMKRHNGLKRWATVNIPTKFLRSNDLSWYKFYTSNKLKDGDVCSFELHPHSRRSKTVVMDVHINRSSP
ncbi:hypothetical protein CDL12_10933 [Handroanthus impetiginosus]|uniref:TF-B3 domain-containing protein n=1 Tax=Handroanthus impetiginosus TaxID=429701 RepID=A0A2G9HFX6_9LAMI|nr:hypothetical protein CDL12_10933 [Handroanthus impetiginosus]